MESALREEVASAPARFDTHDWNDVAPRNRVLPSQVHALQRYQPCIFDPLQTSMLRVPGPNRHVFSFYRK